MKENTRPDLHDADGVGGIFERCQPQHDRLVRQARLVEYEDGIAGLDKRRMPFPGQLSLP